MWSRLISLRARLGGDRVQDGEETARPSAALGKAAAIFCADSIWVEHLMGLDFRRRLVK